jgi:hypothetical protein
MSDQEDRAYKSADFPTLRVDAPPAFNPDLLLKLYEQTCTTWRALVDVRFKLLALVPTASLVALATLVSAGDSTKFLGPRLLFSILGLVTTSGLLVYDLRNSQLHDDLISRGRKIEDELGVHTGVFRGRKKPKGLINHGTATRLIYGSALVAWVAAIWVSVRGV